MKGIKIKGMDAFDNFEVNPKDSTKVQMTGIPKNMLKENFSQTTAFLYSFQLLQKCRITYTTE